MAAASVTVSALLYTAASPRDQSTTTASPSAASASLRAVEAAHSISWWKKRSERRAAHNLTTDGDERHNATSTTSSAVGPSARDDDDAAASAADDAASSSSSSSSSGGGANGNETAHWLAAACDPTFIITNTNASSHQPLWAEVRLRLDPDCPKVGLAISYQPADTTTNLEPLWSALVEARGGADYELELYRLRPKTRYAYQLWARPLDDDGAFEAAGKVMLGQRKLFWSESTGVPMFDTGAPFANVSGSKPFGFEMATFSCFKYLHKTAAKSSSSSKSSSTKSSSSKSSKSSSSSGGRALGSQSGDDDDGDDGGHSWTWNKGGNNDGWWNGNDDDDDGGDAGDDLRSGASGGSRAGQHHSSGGSDDDRPAVQAKGSPIYEDAVVAIDGEGYVVWHYHSDIPFAWDFLPSDAADGAYDVVIAAALTEELSYETVDDGDGEFSHVGDAGGFGRRRAAAAVRGAGGKAGGGGGESEGDDDDDADVSSAGRGRSKTHYWHAKTQMKQIDGRGEMVSQTAQACAGAPVNNWGVNHECRVNPTSADSKVWSLADSIKHFPDVDVLYGGKDWTTDTFVAEQVVAWDRATGEVAHVLDLFDYVSPLTEMHQENTWAVDEYLACSGNVSIQATEFTHTSALAFGPYGNVLLALRALNAVISFDQATAEVQWVLSNTINSTYAFERPADEFTAPHALYQEPDGDLVLMDDGTNRVGCRGYSGMHADDVQCFSRAVRYELNEKTRVAKLVWQFEWPVLLSSDAASGPNMQEGNNGVALTDAAAKARVWDIVTEHDLYNMVGGSAYQLDSGNYLVGFTSIPLNTFEYDEQGNMLAFEVAEDDPANVVNAMHMPNCAAATQGGYRLKPWRSVRGESALCPLDSAPDQPPPHHPPAPTPAP